MIIRDILSDLHGTLAADESVIAKKTLAERIYDRGRENRDDRGCNCIMIQLSNSMDWWSVFIYGLLFCRRLVIVEPGLDERSVNSIVEECKVSRIFYWNTKKELKVNNVNQNSFFVNEQELVLYTTGTTGKPKGVVISVDRYLENITDINSKLGINENDVSLNILSNAHALGLSMSTLFFLFGGDIHQCSDVVDFYKKIIEGNFNVITLQPAMLGKIVRDSRILEAMKKMKCIITGGSPLHKGLRDRLSNSGVKLVNMYGTTECTPAIACTDLRQGNDDSGVRLLNGVDAYVSDMQEIIIKGKVVHKRYIDGSYICDSDGWYHTKDAGEIINNKIYIYNRLDDVVVLDNGFKVNLCELEERICNLDEVEDALVYFKEGGLYADIVSKGECEIAENKIRSILRYYEAVNIRFVMQIALSNGKKKRRI